MHQQDTHPFTRFLQVSVQNRPFQIRDDGLGFALSQPIHEKICKLSIEKVIGTRWIRDR